MTEKEPITILCATDNNYAPYCGIMLMSLFESNKDCAFSVYVMLNGDFSSRNRRKYKKLEEKYGNSITLITMDEELFAKLPRHSDGPLSAITSPTYYRLMAASILPKEVRKCIYLDCDIIVCGDVKGLWNVDLTGKAVGGVKDCTSEQQRQRLIYSSDYDYINAGVSVYNLEYWRENNVQELCFDYIETHKDEIFLMDQDAINGLLYTKTVLFPERYNFQSLFFEKGHWKNYDESYREELVNECSKAVIIHYISTQKPWHFKSYGGFCFELWDGFRKVSFWRNCRIRKPIEKYAKFLVKRLLFPSLLKSQVEDMWVVLPETRHLFGYDFDNV